METLTIRISHEDKILLKEYAKFNGITLSDLIRQSALEKAEEMIDRELYKMAVEVSERNEETFTHEQVLKDLGLENVPS